MIVKAENRIEYFGMTILVVLFSLVFAVSHQNSTVTDNTLRVHYQLLSVETPAVPSKDIPKLTYEKIFVSLVDVIDYKLFYRYLKVISDNRLINQRIAFLRKVELIIKPTPPGFCYHFQLLYSEDIPILS
jgi:VanZ family protein